MRISDAEKEEDRMYRESAAKIFFLNKVINFSKLMCAEHGRVVKRRAGSGFVRTIQEARNVNDFSYHFDEHQSMMGGNTLRIWHHTGSEFSKKMVPVLEIEWQFAVEDAKAKESTPDQKWRSELLKQIELQRRSEIQAQRAVAEKKAKKKNDLTQYQIEMREARREGKIS